MVLLVIRTFTCHVKSGVEIDDLTAMMIEGLIETEAPTPNITVWTYSKKKPAYLQFSARLTFNNAGELERQLDNEKKAGKGGIEIISNEIVIHAIS